MRKQLILLLSGSFLFFACRQAPNSNSSQDTPENSFSKVAYPFKASADKIKQVSAHRGGGDISGYPENCLESMMYIDEQVGAWMEIDVRATKDGHLVLMHDASVDRTTNGNGKVENMTLSDFQSLKLKDNAGKETDFRPPTLEKVLRWNESEGNTVLNLDIKHGVDYRDLIDLVKKTDQIDNVIAIVYSIDAAKALRRINDDIVISLPVRSMEEWQRLKASSLSMDNLIAFTGTIRSSRELYNTLHDNGMLAIFGTMGNIDRQAERRGKQVYQDLYDDGADVLSTDRPLEVAD